MKKPIYFLVLSLLLGSCSADADLSVTNEGLVGEWRWTNTDGGLGYHIHETPESTGKEIHLKLNANYTYSVEENGKEISSGTYQLAHRESISHPERKRFITYSDDTHMSAVVLSGIITTPEPGILYISDNNHDGIGSLFQQVK